MLCVTAEAAVSGDSGSVAIRTHLSLEPQQHAARMTVSVVRAQAPTIRTVMQHSA